MKKWRVKATEYHKTHEQPNPNEGNLFDKTLM